MYIPLKCFHHSAGKTRLPCAHAGPKKPEEKAEDEEQVTPTELEVSDGEEEEDYPEGDDDSDCEESKGEVQVEVSDLEVEKESPVSDEEIIGPVSTHPDQVETLPMEEFVESFWRLEVEETDQTEEKTEKKNDSQSPVKTKEEEPLKAKTETKERMAAATNEKETDKTEAKKTAHKMKKTREADTKEQELTPEPANVKSKESKRTNGGENLTSKGLEEVEAPYVEDLVSDEDKAEQEETRGAFKDCHEIG